MIGFVFEGLTGLLVGMLNSLRRFALAAFAPAVGTVVTLVVTIALAPSLGITSLAVGCVAGWVVGLAVLFPGLRGEEIHYRPRIDWHDPGVREVGGMVWPILIGSAVGKVSIFAIQFFGTLPRRGLHLQPQLRGQAVPTPAGAVRRRDNRPHLPPPFGAGGRQGSRAGQGHARLRPPSHGIPAHPGHRGHDSPALPASSVCCWNTASSRPTTPIAPPGPCSSCAWGSMPTPGATPSPGSSTPTTTPARR